MKIEEIKKEILVEYGPVLSLEKVISHLWRRKLELGFLILTVAGLTFSLALYMLNVYDFNHEILSYASKIWGMTGIFAVVWLVFFMLESFYYSFYFKSRIDSKLSLTLDLAMLISGLDGDVTKSFFDSKTGRFLLLRAGIPFENYENFAKNRKQILPIENFEILFKDNEIKIYDFVSALVDSDTELKNFLFSQGIQKSDILGIMEWIVELHVVRVNAERWWSKENLQRYPSVGRDWSYGQIYTLHKYERILGEGSMGRYRVHSSYGVSELLQVEQVLSKSREANVCLVGDDESGKIQMISRLVEMMEESDVPVSLQRKRLIVLDDDRLVALNSNKSDLEKEFITLMDEAVRAGNVVLAFMDIPGFIRSASTTGVDIPSILEKYLSSYHIQVIAVSDTDSYHNVVEKNPVLIEHLETVLIKEIDDTNTIKVLENEVILLESNGLFFTYPALLSIIESAERYFPSGVMPDKAVDLLLEISPKLLAKKKKVVLKQDILEMVESKTGIPVSGVSENEKDKLLNLESILHKRIIGQNEAIDTISNAVRRARSGINNPDRPLGSFLFLGPTGVGKTETTKALADVFFGEKAKILRLDMSEYSSFDSVTKLIGSFETGQAGVLTNMVKEHQYGVLLLDEFEKTTKEVMNLFLQILDEGFFSDGNGKKINTRNLIIIATSNAGSELIWEAMKKGDDLSKYKDEVIDSIIKQGIFKPELINRFDGVVLFHPLDSENLRKITEIQLSKLKDRLTQKGIDLEINDALVNYVVGFGSDPKFGARPIARAIQEKVEEIVAKKIIEGNAKPGSSLTLTEDDLV